MADQSDGVARLIIHFGDGRFMCDVLCYNFGRFRVVFEAGDGSGRCGVCFYFWGFEWVFFFEGRTGLILCIGFLIGLIFGLF